MKFNIGGLFYFDEYIFDNLIPFRKDIIVYGGINCLWHGGRSIISNYTIEDIESIINKYNNINIPCRFTFSNHKLTKEDLNDELCNNILDILAKNEMNGVIISSDLLYDYIKSKYPNMKIVCSVIKTCIETDNWKTETPELYNSLCEKYDYVVLNQNRNTDLSFLLQLKYKDKIELLINNRCAVFCPKSTYHYNLTVDLIKSTLNNDYSKIGDKLDVLICECGLRRKFSETCYLNHDQFNKLKDIGFTNFKIEGRGQVLQLFSQDINYFLLS